MSRASIIESVIDVTSALDASLTKLSIHSHQNTNPGRTSAAYLIKHDNFSTKADVDFVKSLKVKDSDVRFMISVKVVSHVSHDISLTKFHPIAGLNLRAKALLRYMETVSSLVSFNHSVANECISSPPKLLTDTFPTKNSNMAACVFTAVMVREGETHAQRMPR